MNETHRYVDVTLPLPLNRAFTYELPPSLQGKVEPGQRVVVPFGSSKLYSALIRRTHSNTPEAYTPKRVETLLDNTPVVLPTQFRLWDWISEYYMATPGEVMNAALPGSLKLSSETRVVRYRDHEPDPGELTDEEYLILEALDHQEVLSLKDIEGILDKKTIQPVIQGLIQKRAILLEETIQEKYKPRRETYVRLTPWAEKEENLSATFDALEKAPKQQSLLMAYIQKRGEQNEKAPWIRQSAILTRARATHDVVKALSDKGILETEKMEVGRQKEAEQTEGGDKELTPVQTEALEGIRAEWKTHSTVLLQGVTSSGKTELYIKLIRERIEAGEQVLYLLPEIALTTQMIGRLRHRFGDRIAVYHSRFSDNERTEVWERLQNPDKTPYDVILGARSALFLPFTNLGLVIVDEEHEHSFKQFDPAPRYHARDTAIMLAHIHGAKTLLGTATPSVESYYNAMKGKYGFVPLKERFRGIKMPAIECIDLRTEHKKRKMRSLFSSRLLDGIRQTLANDEQVILFQNRRGYSPLLHCQDCGWIPECKNCDISLNYHKSRNSLNCHYCGYVRKPPSVCEACGSSAVKMLGFGTEKVEEELKWLLPDARIARMDLDTTRKKHAFQQMINDLEDGSIDILVGTQMVTKGLDFENIGLVGILSADLMLSFPDLRASERSYQLMAQVAGRTGRKKRQGQVMIQTFQPEHQVIRHVVKGETDAMLRGELKERRKFHYPPFYRLVRLTLKHRSREKVNIWGKELSTILRKTLGDRVLGPVFPPVSRVRNKYRKQLLVKLERGLDLKKAKQTLHQGIGELNKDKEGKKVTVVVDVDPL